MRLKSRPLVHFGLCLLAGLAPAAGAAQASRAAAAAAASRRDSSVSIEVATFDSAWQRIRSTYYDSTMHGLDWEKVRAELRPRVALANSRSETRAAISDMISRLGDSHFAVLPADAVGNGQSAPASDLPGDIGVELRLLHGALVVTEVDTAGPASHAGVRAGWTLASADGESVAHRLATLAPMPEGHQRKVASLRVAMELAHKLSGAPGSVTHPVFRDGAGTLREFALQRRVPTGTIVRLGGLPPFSAQLDWSRLGEGSDCIGVIRFNIWMTAIAPAFEQAMQALHGCRGIALDLRGNIGGVAAMVMGFAGYFFDDDVSLGSLRMRDANLRYVANPRRVAHDGSPLPAYAGAVAILVDAQSASTSEIFAGALQQLGRARVFGDTTAGQALPSLLDHLPNGDGLLYAIADFVAPGGRRIEGAGVIPDTPIQPARAALLAGDDPVRAAAIRWMSGDAGVSAGRPHSR